MSGLADKLRAALTLTMRTREIGGDALAALRAAGTPESARWVALRGAKRYWSAVFAGDVASDDEIERRRGVCRACLVRVTVEGADWCGEPFSGAPPEAEPSEAGLPGGCGCLLKAKTAVGSESCPLGRWGSSVDEGGGDGGGG